MHTDPVEDGQARRRVEHRVQALAHACEVLRHLIDALPDHLLARVNDLHHVPRPRVVHGMRHKVEPEVVRQELEHVRVLRAPEVA